MPNHRQLPLDNDAVALWRFDEPNPTDNCADETGNGHTAVQTSSPPVVVGLWGNARAPNDGDYFTVSDVPSLQLQTFTVVAWVYYDGSGTHEFNNPIMHYDHQTNHHAWLLAFAAPGGRDSAPFLYVESAAGNQSAGGYSELSVGWHLVGGTRTSTNLKFYIDGGLVEEKTYSSRTVRYGSDYITLGNNRDATQTPFPGYIDEIGYYNTVKSGAWFKRLWDYMDLAGGPHFRVSLDPKRRSGPRQQDGSMQSDIQIVSGVQNITTFDGGQLDS